MAGARHPDGIDAGTNERFEARFWTFQRLAWLLMTLFVAAGLCGVFGRGPLVAATAPLADGSRLEYERVLRFKTPTRYRLVLAPEAGAASAELRLRLDAGLLGKLGLRADQSVPIPAAALPDGDGLVLVYPVARGPRPLRLELSFEPKSMGRVSGRLEASGAGAVEVRQFVVP